MTEQSYYLSGFTNYATERDVNRARQSIGSQFGPDAISVHTHEDGMVTINYLTLKPVQHGQVAWQGTIEQ